MYEFLVTFVIVLSGGIVGWSVGVYLYRLWLERKVRREENEVKEEVQKEIKERYGYDTETSEEFNTRRRE